MTLGKRKWFTFFGCFHALNDDLLSATLRDLARLQLTSPNVRRKYFTVSIKSTFSFLASSFSFLMISCYFFFLPCRATARWQEKLWETHSRIHAEQKSDDLTAQMTFKNYNDWVWANALAFTKPSMKWKKTKAPHFILRSHEKHKNRSPINGPINAFNSGQHMNASITFKWTVMFSSHPYWNDRAIRIQLVNLVTKLLFGIVD